MKPVTKKVGTALMTAFAVINKMVENPVKELMNLDIKERLDIMEFSAGDKPMISEAAAQVDMACGFQSIMGGCDLHRETGEEVALAMVREHRPRKAWFTAPCSPGKPKEATKPASFHHR